MIGSIIQGMVIDMNETRLRSLEQFQAFLGATVEVQFLPPNGEDARYGHIEAVFGCRRYFAQNQTSIGLEWLTACMAK